MSIWSNILKYDRPPSTLDVGAYVVAQRDVKHLSGYEDILMIDATMYASTNRRFSLNGTPNQQIEEFYWAPTLEILMRAVYGFRNRDMETIGDPPRELLVSAGCLTYATIRAHAEGRSLKYHTRYVTSQELAYSGVSLTVGRFEYYFVCPTEESVEIKDWSMTPFSVVAFKTEKGRSLE
jgi:hypothetical protein